MDLTLPLDLGSCRAPPNHAQGYGAMPEAAPSSDPQPATALPNSTQAALCSLSESATLSQPSQTSSRAEISVEAKPLSVSFSLADPRVVVVALDHRLTAADLSTLIVLRRLRSHTRHHLPDCLCAAILR